MRAFRADGREADELRELRAVADFGKTREETFDSLAEWVVIVDVFRSWKTPVDRVQLVQFDFGLSEERSSTGFASIGPRYAILSHFGAAFARSVNRFTNSARPG